MSRRPYTEYLDWYGKFSVRANLENWNLVWTNRPLFWVLNGKGRVRDEELFRLMSGMTDMHKEARRLLRTYDPERYQEYVHRFLELKVQR